jgi:hypothetical protein
MRFSDKDVINALSGKIAASSLRKVAAEIGVTPAFISFVMHEKCPPGPKVAKFLGFQDDGLRWVKGKPAKG